MADLTEVSEELLRIIFAEQISHLRVLEIARPCTRGHGQGLEDEEKRRTGKEDEEKRRTGEERSKVKTR